MNKDMEPADGVRLRLNLFLRIEWARQGLGDSPEEGRLLKERHRWTR